MVSQARHLWGHRRGRGYGIGKSQPPVDECDADALVHMGFPFVFILSISCLWMIGAERDA